MHLYIVCRSKVSQLQSSFFPYNVVIINALRLSRNLYREIAITRCHGNDLQRAVLTPALRSLRAPLFISDNITFLNRIPNQSTHCTVHAVRQTMGVNPPFLYDAVKTEGPRSPYKDFDPKAVTRASHEPRAPRPKSTGPLISFNQHPEYVLSQWRMEIVLIGFIVRILFYLMGRPMRNQ
jgi:hypothetical protein